MKILEKCPTCQHDLLNIIYELKDGTHELAKQVCIHCTYVNPVGEKIEVQEEVEEVS